MPTYRSRKHFTLAGYALRLVLLAGLFSIATCAQCVPGGLAVVVNKANPVEALSMAQLRRLIMGDVRSWQDRKPVLLVARDASTKTFQCMITSIAKMSVADYKRYIINAEFRGEDPMVIQTADSNAVAARLVIQSPGAIAVIDASALTSLGDSVKIIRVDGKSPGQAGYPLL
jgi:phosphate transport system substrate-binding protein